MKGGRNRHFWIILVLGLASLACRAAERAFNPSPQAVITVLPPTEQAGSPVETTLAPGSGTPVAGPSRGEGGLSPLPTPVETAVIETPLPARKPAQSQGAGIQPAELRPALTRLSGLTGFRVLDREGVELGVISDFIANTCETYLIYFLVDPAEHLGLPEGVRIVAPFELVTINSGVLDAQARTVQLSLAASQFRNPPVFPESQELLPVDWEAGVREYWKKLAWVSNLTTGCRVSLPEGGATEIHKVAYGSELIGAALRDGLGNTLGTVEEAILEPESGKLSFFVVRLAEGHGLVLVPLRVVNIPKEALEPGAEVSLVLLVENGVLFGAPVISSVEEAVQGGVQASARAYWNR